MVAVSVGMVIDMTYCETCGHYEVCKDKAERWVNCPDYIEPVKHGKWEGYHGDKLCKDGEYRHYHFYVCSNCGRRTAVKTNFCPDCGCRMDGD